MGSGYRGSRSAQKQHHLLSHLGRGSKGGCTWPRTSGQCLQPWGSKVLQNQIYWELLPQQRPAGSPINILFKPRSSWCLCFATGFIAEAVFRLCGSQSVGWCLCICLGACQATHPPTTAAFGVSLDDDDGESVKQESDEPDTTDSEVGLLSSGISLGCWVQEAQDGLSPPEVTLGVTRCQTPFPHCYPSWC